MKYGHKYDDIFGYVADCTVLNGCADDSFGDTQKRGFFARITIEGVDSLNDTLSESISEFIVEAKADYRTECDRREFSHDTELYVIIKENNEGFVTTLLVTDLQTEALEEWQRLESIYNNS